jgi:hypothetical protein
MFSSSPMDDSEDEPQQQSLLSPSHHHHQHSPTTRTKQQQQLHRINKLGQLTGRKNSVEQLQVYLSPAVTSVDEAQRNREHIEKSDRMKKLFGTRPPNSTTSGHSREAPAASTSPVSPSGATTSRVAKIRSMTGRRMSVDAIQDLLMPDTPEQAVANGRLIERSDKLRHVLGQRPPTQAIMDDGGAHSHSNPHSHSHSHKMTTRRMSLSAKMAFSGSSN